MKKTLQFIGSVFLLSAWGAVLAIFIISIGRFS